MAKTIRLGSKVAFLNDNLRGTITRIMGNGQVMVELEDGFEIPTHIRELVLHGQPVDDEDDFRPASAPKEEAVQPAAAQHSQRSGPEGIFLAAAVVHAKPRPEQVELSIVNQKSHTALYAFYQLRAGEYRLEAQGELPPFTHVQVVRFPLSQAENFRSWQVRLLSLPPRGQALPTMLDLLVRLKPSRLIEAKDELPGMQARGWVMVLKPEVQEKPEPNLPRFATNDTTPVPEIVDLHIEKILGKGTPPPDIDILQTQIQYFENLLEKAMAQERERVIFIHGIGNGVLKKEIQNRLRGREGVLRYEEADTRLFGYGATAVYLKKQ